MIANDQEPVDQFTPMRRGIGRKVVEQSPGPRVTGAKGDATIFSKGSERGRNYFLERTGQLIPAIKGEITCQKRDGPKKNSSAFTAPCG